MYFQFALLLELGKSAACGIRHNDEKGSYRLLWKWMLWSHHAPAPMRPSSQHDSPRDAAGKQEKNGIIVMVKTPSSAALSSPTTQQIMI